MIDKKLKNYINKSIEVKNSLLENRVEIKKSINQIYKSLKSGGKYLLQVMEVLRLTHNT